MTEFNDSDDDEAFPPVKVVVVGDGGVGKTSLLISFTRNEFPTEYVPTVFENLTKSVTIIHNGNEDKVTLDLWDTAGQEDFNRIRPLTYRDTDIFLVCFCVTSPSTFANITLKWFPEIKNHHQKNENYQLLLVGLKSDLRNDESELKQLEEKSQKPVELNEIEECVKHINAVSYVECSALTRKNVNLVFENAVKAFLDPKNEPQKQVENEKPPSQCVSAGNLLYYFMFFVIIYVK